MSEDKTKKEKIVFDETINCAHCGKPNQVKKLRRLVGAAVKAEYQERVVVEKAMVDSKLD
jgi:hypothetical protein